jgi:YYY domain-containing protein
MEPTDSSPRITRQQLPLVALVLILAVAAVLRLVGLDWDEGTHLHPDERFLTTVETAIEPTFSLGEYFSTASSPLSPYNRGHGFFVYGTLPIFLVRYVAEALQAACASSPDCTFPFTGYDGVHLVGRFLSAIADLGTVVVIYLIGRRLYDQRVGLLAAALGALAVLPIQQAHFFTVDTFLTFFVALAFFFAVRVALGSEGRDWGLFGLAFGMALACKISVWPMGLVLVTAAFIRMVRARDLEFSGYFLGLAVAAVIAFAAFRVLQPYSFAGPGFTREALGDERFVSATAAAPEWWPKAHDLLPEPLRALVLPAPEWLGNMRTIRDQMGGNVDFPPNHQWTDRTPIVFPWKSMVLYGMGPFLGLAAWAGWAAALAGMVLWRGRSRWQQHLMPILWVTLFFLYQGTQWVKSMRYLMPVYPLLILLGAWALVALWDSLAAHRGTTQEMAEECLPVDEQALFLSRPGRHGRWTWIAGGLAALVLIGTALWAWSFTGIYRRTFTRVAASRWIYENVPTGASLLYEAADGEAELQIPIPILEYSADGMSHVTRFEMPVDGVVTGVRMNHLSDPLLDAEEEVFRVAVSEQLGSEGALAAELRALNLQESTNPRGDSFEFRFTPTRLVGGQTYFLMTEVTAGAPVRSTGAFLVNETSWDDGLPWRVDGLDGFSMYEGSPLELYWEDDAAKRDRMLDLLDRGDYLFISSTRQLGSITRLPPRYPLTIAYYQALFGGELGYELIETFMGDIHIGPLIIDDVFGELGWGKAPEVGWPPPGEWAAEEAFSVYDHPPVWIFKKQPDYSSAKVRAALEAVDIDRRRFVIPLDYTNELKDTRRPLILRLLWPDTTAAEEPQPGDGRSMWLSADELAEQQAGGTWRELFDPDGLLSRYEWLGAAVWWLAVLLLGWLAFPLASVALGGLPSKGYVVSKALALLVLSWFAWIAVSAGLLPYTRGTVWLAIGLLAAIGVGVGWWQRRQLTTFVLHHWRLLLVVEGVALVLYLISLLIRSGNPDLWHPTFGGEKPMNLAMLNAVLKSTRFPPYDAWLAGAYLNYYYYGYVLIGNLIKVLRIVPSVAYNLALPMLFSLTGIGAFSVSYDLVEGVRRRKDGGGGVNWSRKALYAGLAAAVVVVLLGNLGQVWTFLHGWNRLGGDEGSWLIQTGRGLVRNLSGESIPIHTGSWYWDATRIIPPGEGEAGPITEFPFFTFLYADLHAHMMDMPLVLLALAWALGLAQWAGRRPAAQASGLSAGIVLRLVVVWLIGGLAIGALRATNTWDWPTLLGVGAVAVTYSAWRSLDRGWAWLGGALLGIGALVGLGALLFLPYSENFVPAYTEVMRWRGGITPVWAYFAVHGLFLFVLVTLLGREFRDWALHLSDAGLEALEPWGWLIGLGVLAFLGLMVAMLVMGVPVGPLVLLIMAPAGLLALQPRLTVERRAVLMLLALGLALTLAVELVVLSGDISRMNTVFKFCVQVWLIFSAIGGAALVWSWESVRRWKPIPRQAWLAALGCLVFAAALYPPTAVRAKVTDRFHEDQPPAGLDGMAFMLTATYYDRDQAMELRYDYGVIRWLQDNVTGSPVIMEANTYPKIYGWGNRISIYTGLPTVVGWEWHTRQHRAGFPNAEAEVRRRAADVITFYNTPDMEQALNILHTYGVTYVIVGPLERAYSSPEGIDKLGLMAGQGMLTEVYRNEGAVIYQVR